MMLAANLVLALLWCALWGRYSFVFMATGFAVGYLFLWILSRRGVVSSEGYLQKVHKVLGLLVFFLWELLLANLRLAQDTITFGLKVRPTIVRVPLDAKTDSEIFLFSVLVTLTPGTMSMEVDKTRQALWVHVLYPDGGAEATAQQLKDGFERRVLEVLRP
jgi:multicomponent Na+:H+ antiporter subunit E